MLVQEGIIPNSGTGENAGDYAFAAANTAPEPVFKASPQEKTAALTMFAAAMVYSESLLFCELKSSLWYGVFAALFIAAVEVICSGKTRSRESNVWLVCLAAVSLEASAAGLGFTFGFMSDKVWDLGQTILFMHIFGVWWAISRSGALLENESGHLLAADAFNGFVRFPFGNFFLRARVVFSGLGDALKNRKRRSLSVFFWTLSALLLALAILSLAIDQLSMADDSFSLLMSDVRDFFTFDIGEDLIVHLLCFIVSLPIGAYLYGLIGGSSRISREKLDAEKNLIYRVIESIGRVPVRVWIGVIAVFTAVYLAFFFIQGEYLFGAFVRKLPEGFIVSQYARQGFFELCRVSALNFSLLWLVTRVSDRRPENSRLLKISSVVFLAENMLMCVIAFSKLMLYINCFGFTPLRLQSSWLVCVLFAAGALWMVSLLTGRKTFKTWMYFGAASLTLLALI